MLRCYTFLFLFAWLGQAATANAQCGEVFFYRPTGLQGEEPVYLFQDGVQIATLGLGDRYRATVCQAATFFFDVRFRPNALPVSKTSVLVRPGERHYLKVNLPVGLELPTINQRAPAKGEKDLAKGNRFRGPVRTLTLRDGALATAAGGGATNAGSGTGQTGSPASSSTSVGNVQVVDNFRFELTKVVRVGDMARLEWKITNLAPDDRTLWFCPNSIHFYDNQGNLFFGSKTCLINSCHGNDQQVNATQLSERFPCYQRYASNAVMPSQIPVNGSVVVRGLKNGTTHFVRGKLRFHAEAASEVGYTQLSFPEVEVDNYTRRYDQETVRYLGASRQGQDLHVRFRLNNLGSRPTTLVLQSAQLYDQDGSLYEADRARYGNDPQDKYLRTYRPYTPTVQPGDAIQYTLIFPKISAATNRIVRLSVGHENYHHSWEDLPLSVAPAAGATPPGRSTSAPAATYVTYSDFSGRVNRGERVAGKRVILKQLYFDTGSNRLLPNSHPQLDQLADLLQQNLSLRLEVSGHTDASGDTNANLLLSQRRADEVRYYLIGKQIDPARVSSVGKGESEPVSDNNSTEGRASNRRVEILVLD